MLNRWLIWLGIAILIVIIVGVFGVIANNRLVNLRERVRNSKAQIAAQTESRWDGLSNVLKAAEKYSAHEKETLKEIINQRSGVSQNANVKALEEDETLFNRAMVSVKALAENYPDLKADGLYRDAIHSINDYERNVKNTRMAYNDSVSRYNRKLQQFPSSIVANALNFQPAPYFEGTHEKVTPPTWSE